LPVFPGARDEDVEQGLLGRRRIAFVDVGSDRRAPGHRLERELSALVGQLCV
jgi:hypothetical protein